VSIKVGPGETMAHTRIGSVSGLLDWLASIVAAARTA
jgi:trehalose 6-phosphate phosphatase